MQYIKYHAQNAPRNMLAKPQERLRKEQQSIPDGAERNTKNNCCNLQKRTMALYTITIIQDTK